MILTETDCSIREKKPVPITFYPPQMPHELAWDRTQVSTVTFDREVLIHGLSIHLFVCYSKGTRFVRNCPH